VTGALPASLKTPLRREALLAGGLAASVTALLLWLGPPGNDLAAHLYQRAVFLEHGFVLWNNFWYAGRYSFVTYSVLYYPLSALLGVKVLALASITAAAIGFTVVVGREWGLTARWSSRTFAVVWAGTVLSAAFPFALGAALALLALWALQQGFRGRFALLVILTLAASPLAFALLVVVLAGVALTRRARPRRIAVPVAVVAAAGLVELIVLRLFPDGGRYPFSAWGLIPAAAFCALGALVGWRRGRPLVGIYLAYLAACLLAYAIPSTLGSNIERLRYAAIPLAVLSVSTAGWRPLKLALPLLVVATTWNVTPLIANFRNAAGDPASSVTYWQPALRYLDRRLTPSYRVEAVDTLEHWPALFLPEAGVSIVRGWYRQNDFPTNEVLYGRVGPDAYRRWLTGLGVRFVVLSDAPPDYSSRPEAALVRGGIAGLHPVFRARHLTIYELDGAKPIITGPAKASVIQMQSARVVLRVGAPGNYRLAVRFSPYWQTLEGCVAPSRDGMIRLTAFEAGRIDLEFDVSVHRGLEVLTGSEPSRVCHG
jgi:hypothetical protein